MVKLEKIYSKCMQKLRLIDRAIGEAIFEITNTAVIVVLLTTLCIFLKSILNCYL